MLLYVFWKNKSNMRSIIIITIKYYIIDIPYLFCIVFLLFIETPLYLYQ